MLFAWINGSIGFNINEDYEFEKENYLNKEKEKRLFKKFSKYEKDIKYFSKQYDFDWRLILAVLRVESTFDDSAISEKGATGLMQLMPVTKSAIIKDLKISDDSNSTRNNIKSGIYYLSVLRNQLTKQNISDDDILQLTLASYNGGIGRVIDAQKIAKLIHNESINYDDVKHAMPLLSKKYSSLHYQIWKTQLPPSGYFRDWKGTVRYVDEVLKYYNIYKNIYPNNI